MRWSVGIEAQGDRALSREEVVELADAVAASDGIASGVGSRRYGVTLVVQAGSPARFRALVNSSVALAIASARLLACTTSVTP